MSTIKNPPPGLLRPLVTSEGPGNTGIVPPGIKTPVNTGIVPPSIPISGGLRGAIDRARSSELSGAQAKQLEQIQQGVANGTISEKEASALLDQQSAIANAMKVAQSDGFISADEQKAIAHQQAQAGASIKQSTQSNELSSLFQDPAVTQKQASQIGEIAKGIRSGELSGAEASKLLSGQSDIAHNVARSENGIGQLSNSEVSQLSQQQAQAGRDISRESHNFEKAPHGKPSFELPHQPPHLPHLPVDPLPHLPPGGGFIPPHLPVHPLPLPGPVDPLKADATKFAHTQGDQLQQIQQGVANGTISEKEASKLLKEQASLSEAMKRAQSDQKLSPREMAVLEKQQAKAAADIKKATSSNELSSLFQDSRVTQAQAAQIGKIAQGIRSGELSGAEATRDLNAQANIAHDISKAENGLGMMSGAELSRIAHQQSGAGKTLERDLHNTSKAVQAQPPKPTFKSNSAELANLQSQMVDKIAQGLANGTISEKAAADLIKQQSALSEAVKRAESDGKLSPKEMKALRQQFTKVGDSIPQHHPGPLESLLRKPVSPTVQTQVDQLRGIAQGLRSGQLSGNEASKLLGEQSGIAQQASQPGTGLLGELHKAEVALSQAEAGLDILEDKTNKEKAPHAATPRPPIIFG